MMNNIDVERFNTRIFGQSLISAYIYINSSVTVSAAEVEVILPDDDYQKELDLYERLCKFAVLHGSDFQGLFYTNRYYYMSCFVRDVEAFKTEFEKDEILNTLFNHGKGETTEFIISFPEKANYDGKESVKKAFLDIIQKHVDTLDKFTWNNFEHRAFTGGTVGFDDERDKIKKLSRKDFVATNLTDSFEPDFYVNPLFKKAKEIGEIDGHYVYFNSRGFYFYWNKETEYLLESWLTFPAYPYGW